MIQSSTVLSSSSILVKWNAVTTVAKPVTAYTLYYNANNEKIQHSVNVSIRDTNNYEYRLTKLHQMTAYSISVSATNIYGEGTISEPIIEITQSLGRYSPVILKMYKLL